MRILMVDNKDSFTRNLEHLIVAASGSVPVIVPYATFFPEMVHGYDVTVLSPGPGHPDDYPGYKGLFGPGRPVLGICLGLQIINVHFGGAVDRLQGCIHGRISRFTLFGKEIEAARYHSLYLSQVAADLDVLAEFQGIPMAAKHKRLPVLGLQFHPESFLTPQGEGIIRDALQMLLSG
ncbi:MAG: aminodeoxychorismate/anthranilate synthase component II [Desulfovibrio sp.]|nr:aminodeoxychorismate/anthranilate synthase component II [Desulfovibrio sp.]MBI4960704.1 aminodeoxychorismate/anthranilate synthase component II [Desulfovibrio sp.]